MALQRMPLACAALALVTASVALLPALRPADWNITILPRVGEGTGMAQAARDRDPNFRLVPVGAYDGQFYWGIAVDPLARGDVHQQFDTASYRYGHPLFGWVGWILSGGQARAAAPALLFAGLVSLIAAAYVASLLGLARGSSGWEGMFVALNPGLVYSSVHFLTEPLSAVLLLGGLLAYMRNRVWLASAAFGLLVLSKEQFVVVAVTIAAWELVRMGSRLRDVVPYLVSLVPAVVWWIYARAQLGDWFTSGGTAFTFPFAGWKRSILDAGIASYATDPGRASSSEADLVILAALLVLLAVGGVFALRFRGPVDPIYLLLGVVVVCLGPKAVTLIRDALRNTSVMITVFPFVIAGAAIRRDTSRARAR